VSGVPRTEPARRREYAAWILAFLALVAAVYWARELRGGWLLAMGALLVLALASALRLGQLRRRGGLWLAAFISVLTLLGAGGAMQLHTFSRIQHDWDRLRTEREAELGALVARRMAAQLERTSGAARLAAERAHADRRTLFRELDGLRERTGVDAIAVFEADGELVAWAGEHRGPLPPELRLGAAPVFAERPLFSYLYVPVPSPERGRHAVAAALVESGLVLHSGARAPAGARLAGATAGRPVFREGGAPGAAWQFVVGGDTIVHATIEGVTQTEARAEAAILARRAAMALVLVGLLLLGIGWLRAFGRRSRIVSTAPLVAAVLVAAVIPVGGAVGLHRLFSPLLFLLPGPGDVTLGSMLILLVPLAALVASLRSPLADRRAFLATLAAGALAVALGFPAALRLLLEASAPELLEGGLVLWAGLQIAAVLVLSLLVVLTMPRHGPMLLLSADNMRRRPATLLLAGAGLGTAVLLALLALAATAPFRPPPLWLTALWAVPFALIALALAPFGGPGGRLTRWLAAGWLASTAVLPVLWSAHVDARLAATERQLATVGERPDVYLDFLLEEFGREARVRSAAGEDGVLLLYRTWVASGLAREPYAARILLWSDESTIEYELGLGGAPDPDPYLVALPRVVGEARGGTVPYVVPAVGLPGITRVLAVPLDDGRVITVLVPPRRTIGEPAAIAPVLGTIGPADLRFTLVPVRGRPIHEEPLRWRRSAAGWRAETVVRFHDGDFHAHIEVREMSAGVRTARAVLLLALNVSVLALLWCLGGLARGALPVPRSAWGALRGSFRARITMALFLFFIVPTALFGWVAYGALAGEVERAARLVAERAVAQAVLEFPDAAGDLRELASHAGTDILIYHHGELADASSPEALALGVYDAWMPPDVFRALHMDAEDASVVHPHELGGQPFVSAYHIMVPTGTMAVPVSLTAGEAALRQRELAHLILFAALAGGLLSLMLSLMVGRSLAGPMGRLHRAATAVGAGNLKVRLPEEQGGEFGQLFAAFNRMVRRLRRARARELRTERVLAWGGMARQIAHEIKNPLTPIKLSVQHIRRARADRRPDFDEILDGSVEQILQEIDRLAEIARAFSRYGAPPRAAGPLDAVDVAAVVRETLTLYRASDGPIRFLADVEPGLPRARARTDELKEVLLNLLENARDAVGTGGEICVRAHRRDALVELTVSDDGPGIPAEQLPRIFEPHFSTRSTGTGLGLAIVRRIVEDWDGSAGASSDPGAGTTVWVRMRAAGDGDAPPRHTPGDADDPDAPTARLE
jgi:signal transduction histidine kinase